MEKNLGSLDRGLRAGVGLVLLTGMFTWPHSIWGLVGIVPFATAVVGMCPLYRLVGLNTCPTKS